MTRPLILMALALVLHALQAALAVALSTSGLPLTPAVVLVAYAALVEPPVEAALSAALIGLILDSLCGSPIGLNMLSCMLALMGGRFAAGWVRAPRGVDVFLFTAGLSGVYHTFLVVLMAMFAIGESAWSFSGVVSTSIFNGLIALFLVPATQWLFVRLGLEVQEASFDERLRRRAMRPVRK